MSGLIAHLSVVPAAAAAGNTAFVTGQTLSSTLRNDGSGYWTGFKFRPSGADITVTHLGRWKASGDSNTHSIKLFSYDGTPAPIVGGNATVDMSQAADPDGYVYVALATPQVLTGGGGTVYQIGSQENDGVDHFYQNDTIISTTTAATVDQGFYYLNGSSWGWTGSANTTYGPVSFKYHF